MVTVFRIVLISLLLITSAHAGESAGLLAGAVTYFVKLNVHDGKDCVIDRAAVTKRAAHEMAGVAKLRAVAEEAIPDIHITLTVEATPIPPKSEKAEACMYFINLRAIHPMYGQLRYSSAPRLVQALTFNKTVHSVIVPEKLFEAIDLQTSIVFGIFLDEYRMGNSR
jgi:hypothetical protein